MRNIFRVFVLSVLMTICLMSCPSGAWTEEESEISADDVVLHPRAQFELFKKVLYYERALANRAAEGLVIGVLYESGFDISVRAMDGFTRAVREDPALGIDDLVVSALPMNLDAISDLAKSLKDGKVDFLYIAPLSALTGKEDLRKILHDCERMKVPTFTGTIAYVDIGVAVGFGLKTGRPEIKVNLAASKAQGFVFSAQFLKRAGVI